MNNGILSDCDTALNRMRMFNVSQGIKNAWGDENNEPMKLGRALWKAKKHSNFGKTLMSRTEYDREDTEYVEGTRQSRGNTSVSQASS